MRSFYKYKDHIIKILGLPFILLTLVSCVSRVEINEVSFEEVWEIPTPYGSGSGVFALNSYGLRYMGSDEKYDYYKLLGSHRSIKKAFRSPTQKNLFYPHTYPFKGMGYFTKAYIVNRYKGRIIVTPEPEWNKLANYWHRYLENHLLAIYQEEIIKPKVGSEEDVKKIVTQLGLQMLNAWTIKHWGQDRLNIPDSNGTIKVDWCIIDKSGHRPSNAQPYSFRHLMQDVRFGTIK